MPRLSISAILLKNDIKALNNNVEKHNKVVERTYELEMSIGILEQKIKNMEENLENQQPSIMVPIGDLDTVEHNDGDVDTLAQELATIRHNLLTSGFDFVHYLNNQSSIPITSIVMPSSKIVSL